MIALKENDRIIIKQNKKSYAVPIYKVKLSFRYSEEMPLICRDGKAMGLDQWANLHK